ncbi:MAG: hypothetical protein LBU77_07415, partial [Clostridiales bacterium]|nr:hypothetical protein [Clostridiales bacterium]
DPITPLENPTVVVETPRENMPFGSLEVTPETQTGIEIVPENPVPGDKVIPQTGLLRWPVPVMSFGGVALLSLGAVMIKGKRLDEE